MLGGWDTRLTLTLPLPSSKSTFSQPFKDKCISKVVGIGSIIIFHLSKLWKDKFFILCDVIFLVKLQGKFEIDHSWELKGSLKNSPRVKLSLHDSFHPFFLTKMPAMQNRRGKFDARDSKSSFRLT